MNSGLLDGLPLLQQLALAHAPPQHRPAAISAFALDARLAQFVSQASEPLVAQLRLAWWRDELGKLPVDRAKGDAVLDMLGSDWTNGEAKLVALVDGWEQLLAEPPLPADALAEFAAGRSAVFAGLAGLAGHESNHSEAQRAGSIWALGDLAAHMADADERNFVIGQAQAQIEAPIRLPRPLRHLTIMGEIARRSLLQGGSVLLSSRGDYLTIARIGLLGR
uniref:hypothetical protein n=1 Tax=Parerythrobacter lutipelagi TaxID=1964208 RepID=UPI0010F7B0EA|nr:hypothetical protein [Parerythrobacter lutipelagi]